MFMSSIEMIIYLHCKPQTAAVLVSWVCVFITVQHFWCSKAVKKHCCHERWSQVRWSSFRKDWTVIREMQMCFSYFFPYSHVYRCHNLGCVFVWMTHIPAFCLGQLIFWSYPDSDTFRSQGLPCYLGFYIYYKPQSRYHMGIKAASQLPRLRSMTFEVPLKDKRKPVMDMCRLL